MTLSKTTFRDEKVTLIGNHCRVDFSDVEIDVFFGMSDVNGDGTISTDVSLLLL